MRNKKLKLLLIGLSFLALLFASGCTQQSQNTSTTIKNMSTTTSEKQIQDNTSTSTTLPGKDINFILYVSDAPADIQDFDQLMVNFSKARIFRSSEAGGFQELSLNSSSVDLTQLVGSKALPLLDTKLEEGKYTKIELYVSNLRGTVKSAPVKVKVPSEKLQITKTFSIESNKTTNFIFDISVVKKGNQGYNLLPVISESGVEGEDLQEEIEKVECTQEKDCETNEFCKEGDCVEKEMKEKENEQEQGKREKTIKIKNNQFIPPEVEVDIGTEIVWVNKDKVTHKVIARNGTFSSGRLEREENFTYVPQQAGIYKYYCTIHPSMKGTIEVE